MGESYPIEFGEYRLLRKLAQGGMAEIFLAQDQRGEIVAVKRILPHLAHEESFIRMFIDEARIVSHLDHPNVAKVYGQGKIAGYYYIAMEFVQGHSLLALSERARSMKIPLPRGLLAYIIGELLGGLGCAHSARDAKGRHLGIVHRDVTPQNVLISYDGDVKLIDFGVAKARARLTQTEAGFTKGKLSYMSPEQARGEELDSRSDLFSVGIVLYEITTGSRLFNKEGPGGILGAIVNDPIPPPSMRAKDYPKDLESVAMRALEKDVNRRWQTAEEMKDALGRYARKEKPAPGPSRLRDLVHDLFGEPDSQKVIEAAKAVIAPTPPQVAAHKSEVVRGGSLRVKGTDVPEVIAERADPVVGHRSVIAAPPKSSQKVIDDETRMLRPDYEISPKSKVHQKPEVTSEGTPIIDLNLSREAPVPEPIVPLRVRVARFLGQFALDLRASWRAHKRRYIFGGVGVLGLIGVLIAGSAGAVGSVVEWMSDAATRAKELRRSAGLDSKEDAGVSPTVLRLTSDPPGAEIAIDGIGVGGVTPLDVPNLAFGKPLKVELSLPRYRPRTEKVTLWPNQGVQEISMKLERRLGTLVVESDPPGAHVTANGRAVPGRTPVRLERLAADEPVELALTKEGRIGKSTVATPADGEEQHVMVALPINEAAIPPGRIDVKSTPSGCAVTVDDTPVGATPVEGHTVRPGPHSVQVKCENYAGETRAVSVASAKTVALVFSPIPNVFGYLTINPVPMEGSVVELNGHRLDLPVEFKKVTPGRHVVVVSNAGLRKRREETIDVRPNARVTRNINLIQ